MRVHRFIKVNPINPGWSCFYGALLAGLLPLTAWAQVPSAGQALRNIESLQPTLQEPSDLQLQMPKAAEPVRSATDSGGMQVTVEQFVLQGNQVIATDVLLGLLADLDGKALDLAGLRGAAQRITDYYQAHGYVLARAFLPAQDIEHGVVRIEVVEGQFDRIEINNRSRALDAVLHQPLSSLKSGATVKDAELERSLLLLSDLPGVAVRGTLRPGTQRGSTDLVVDAEPGAWINGTLEADNYGGQYTGEYRLGGSLNLNNPLRLGDELSLRALGSDQSQRYYRVGYRLPVGPWSTNVGMSYSQMTYRLGKDFEVLDAHGRATVRSVFGSQSLIRSRVFNLNAQLQYDNKRLQDDIDLFELNSPKRIGLWTAGLNGNSRDLWLGGGQSQWALSYSAGRLSIGNAGQLAQDRSTAGSAGQFARANFSAARLQRLTDHWHLYGQLNAQWASTNLDSSEKFSLGGPNGVRAYALGAGTGDQGWQASAEVRYLPISGVQLSLFADKGAVDINAQPWTNENNRHALASAGVGATWSGTGQQISLTAAWPISAAKQDEGPHQDPRVWVNATQYF
ncbi:Heme/hemopexin utilization protein B precursor [Pseudomonas orientalis]|nr:Heme/hemopexin utilization protein B precursor [Pseudomonas orientalis]